MTTPSCSEQNNTTWALILKKAPGKAKSRLAPVLNREERGELAEKLFRHVLATALSSEKIDRVAVISPESISLPPEVMWVRDTADDMNGCVRQGLACIGALRAQRVVVLPADLPLLAIDDLDDLLGQAADEELVIAPDEGEEGTNALVLHPQSHFSPLFGKNSFHKHMEQARRLGLKTRVVRTSGIAFDLDDEQDWLKYIASNPGTVPALASQ